MRFRDIFLAFLRTWCHGTSLDLHAPFLCPPPTGHRHVSIWEFVPVSLHLHGSSRRCFLRRLLLGSPAPVSECGAPAPQVQPLPPPHDGTGQHPAHHGHAIHERRRRGRRWHRAQSGRHRPRQPRVSRHAGLHVGGDQPLIHGVIRIRVYVSKSGEGGRERAAEHPAPGQRTGLQPGQGAERLALRQHKPQKDFWLHLGQSQIYAGWEKINK